MDLALHNHQWLIYHKRKGKQCKLKKNWLAFIQILLYEDL